MGNWFSTNEGDSAKDVQKTANFAVDEVVNTQDELIKPFELMTIAMQKQQANVEALRNAQKAVQAQLSKAKGDVYGWKAYGETGRRGNNECETCKKNKTLIEEIKTSVSSSEKCIKVLESKMKKLENAYDNKEKLNKKLETEKKNLEQDKESMRHEYGLLLQEKQRAEHEKKQLTEQNRQMEREISSLRDKLEKANQKKVSVSLYCGSQSTLLDASVELQNMLREHWDALGIKTQVDQCLDPRAHTAAIPLIVLCINASRLGTDVSNALQNINCEPSVAVVVLHHKEVHALPSQPSEKLLVGAQYRQIGAIVDIAFLKSKGLYPCDMNEKALDRLTSFIKNFVRHG